MAKRTVIDCDRCNDECTDSVYALALPTKWDRCPSGNGGDHHYEYRHLCIKCTSRLIGILLSKLGVAGRSPNYDLSKEILKDAIGE